MRTKARVRFKKQERIARQASDRILASLSSDQRKILALCAAGYEPGEIGRELALDGEYVALFLAGLIQRLTHDNVIAAPELRNALAWAQDEHLID